MIESLIILVLHPAHCRPVIESLIILDRALFLVEEDEQTGSSDDDGTAVVSAGGVVTVEVEPLFSPLDSPRNFCLIASRQDVN